MNLRNLDLNLLVTLDALLHEQSVTRAAARLHLSQPAVSHALARLREAFGDPLLVRGQHGMTPTPVALSFREPLRRTLEDLEQVLATSRGFDPGKSTVTYRLGVVDYVSFLLLPAVMELLRKRAPSIKLVAVQPSSIEEASDGLANGSLDLAIGFIVAPPPRTRRRVLLHDSFCCLASAAHHDDATLTMTDYIQAAHLGISTSGRLDGLIDATLEHLGMRRNVAMSVPHFFAAAAIAAQTDLLLAAPRRVAAMLTPTLPLRVLELPFNAPRLELSQVWHERTHTDPAQRWLRTMVSAAASGLASGPQG
jgi:DNA-binding transcriptional LysR family regulator